MFDTMGVDHQPIEHAPTSGKASFDGLHIATAVPPIPVTVYGQWSNGTEGEVNGWTGQWTRTHVCVVRETTPPYHPFWVRVSDRERLALSAGEHPKVVQERLGHAAIAVTLDVYSHVTEGLHGDAASRVAGIIFAASVS